MKRLRGYIFKSDRSLAEMFIELNAHGPWEWTERDNEQWGDYLATRGLMDSIAKLFKDDDHYGINLKFDSDNEGAEAQFDTVLDTLLTRVLPSIGALNVCPDEPYF